MNTLASLRLKPAPIAVEGLAAKQMNEATASLMTSLGGLLATAPGSLVHLEFVAQRGSFSLIITAPADWQTDITHYLYAAFPAADLEVLNYEEPHPAGHEVAASVEFAPAEANIREPDLSAGDPLGSLFEILNAVSASDSLTVELTLTSTVAKTTLVSKAVNGFGDLLLQSTRSAILGGAAESDKPENQTDDLKPLIAPFRANLNLHVKSPSTTEAEAIIRRTAGSYHSFALPGKSKARYRIHEHRPGRSGRHFELKTAFLLTPGEAAGLFHPPLTPRSFPNFEALDATRLPIPAGLTEEGILVGYGAHRDHRPPVRLAPADRLRHTYVIGATGTGKSTLLQSAILQDMQNGDGCCFIDPHGEVIDWLLPRIPPERARDVILFDPSDSEALLGLNLLEWRTPDERDLLIQELIALFYKLFDPGHTGIIGPQFEHWLRAAALTVTEPNVRGTLIDIPRLFTDPRFQEATVAKTTHPAARDFWIGQMAGTAAFHKSEMLNYFTSKFGSFLGNTVMNEILSAKTSAFDLRTLMDRRKILLVNLSKGRLGSLNAQLLGTLLVTKLQLAALSRADVPPEQRPPFYVYIDEFQNVVTDSFVAMLSEIRKYGVGLHLAHQYVDQLPEAIKQAVIGNVGTLAAFRLGTTDARWLEPHFAPLKADDLTSLPTGYFHLRTLAGGRPTPPFTVAAEPLPVTPNHAQAEIIRGRVRKFVAATRRPKLEIPPSD